MQKRVFIDLSHDQTDSEQPDYKDKKQKLEQLESGLYLTPIQDIKNDLFPNLIQLPRLFQNLKSMIQFNYMIELSFLLSNLPPHLHKTLPILLVHGMSDQRGLYLKKDCLGYQNIRVELVKMPFSYGIHHTKMMILFYDDGMRIFIHTANMIYRDWGSKTQSGWLSPLLKKTGASSSASGTTNNFKNDFLSYLKAYPAYMNFTIKQIEEYAFSSIPENIHLIPSVPGRHTQNMHQYGHLKVRSVLQQLLTISEPRLVIAQSSSVGSFGSKPEQWLFTEFLNSFKQSPKSEFKFIFPTVMNVRNSFEGYHGGDSIPFSYKTFEKQKYMTAFCQQWESKHLKRDRGMPHVKSYLSTNDGKELGYYLVTSANLSKAAWGSLEKNQKQIFIRNYELGILVTPLPSTQSLKNYQYYPEVKDSIPVPYSFPLVPYEINDQPWCFDRIYEEPDLFGNTWPS